MRWRRHILHDGQVVHENILGSLAVVKRHVLEHLLNGGVLTEDGGVVGRGSPVGQDEGD